MNFIQGRCVVSEESVGLISELLSTLNSCTRRAFCTSLRSAISPNELTEVWAQKNAVYMDCLGPKTPRALMLTSSQKGMVARQAKNLRSTANARAKYLSGHFLELAAACQMALGKKRQQFEDLKAECKVKKGFLNPRAVKKKHEQIEKLRFSLHQMAGRLSRLKSAAERNKRLAETGLASVCFGSRKLASSVHRLGEASSPYSSKESWSQAWDQARDHSWLFEGAKSTKGANENIKWNPDTKVLRIRLTDDQALARMKEKAIKEGLTLKELLDPKKHHSLRMECRFLEVGLDFKKQDKKLVAFLAALTPRNTKLDKDGNLTKGTQPCETPISWRIWIEGDIRRPHSCKLYARAQWRHEETPIITSPSNGCLGVDINLWGLSVAYVNCEGNKPAKGEPFRYDHALDWTSRPDCPLGSEYILHQVRVAAKVVVDGAAKLGVPLALECLDFSKKKAQLRYENKGKEGKQRSAKLSSFAYQKLIEAMLARAAKVGVEVRFVDPSWTSVVGWAKYGLRMGLNAEQAAAFAIARRGVLSCGKNIKRTKRGPKGDAKDACGNHSIHSKWVNLYAKPEKIEGLKNAVGVVVASTAEKQKVKVSKKIEVLTKQNQNGTQQSMRAVKWAAEKHLSFILGVNRAFWAAKLKAHVLQKSKTNLQTTGSGIPEPVVAQETG